jgi:hypothetical protein
MGGGGATEMMMEAESTSEMSVDSYRDPTAQQSESQPSSKQGVVASYRRLV